MTQIQTPSRYNDLAEMKCPALLALYADWESRRGERAFPARADFDPLEMRYILGNLSLIEVMRDPLRFFFRVHASNIADRAGFDMTGKFLDANPDVAHRALVHDHFVATVMQRKPIFARREREFTDRMILQCEALSLPLARDGQTIDMLMTGFVWL